MTNKGSYKCFKVFFSATMDSARNVKISKLSDTKRAHHVTIYGWHRLTGVPIQPVTNIHIDTYVDYSHGVRLVSNKILIDGKEYDYRLILKDSMLHSLLNSEKYPLSVTSHNY